MAEKDARPPLPAYQQMVAEAEASLRPFQQEQHRLHQQRLYRRRQYEEGILEAAIVETEGALAALDRHEPLTPDRVQSIHNWLNVFVDAPTLPQCQLPVGAELCHLMDVLQWLNARLSPTPAECAPEAPACDGKTPPKRQGGGRKRKSSVERKLTGKQLEASQIVAECKGDIAEAARRLGKDAKTVRQHYNAAMKKMGRIAVKHATQKLPLDRRGAANLSEADDMRHR